MNYRKKTFLTLLAFAIAAAAWAASDAYFSSEQNGRVWTMKSGGELNIASGATLSVAGTAINPALYAPLAGAAFTGATSVNVAGEGVELTVAEGATTVAGDLLLTSPTTTAPTDADDECTAGTFIPTATFLYFCSATDTWVRVAVATWP